MKKIASESSRLGEIGENGLLVTVIIGTMIAVGTQEMAWGLIPIAIALVFNRFNRKLERYSNDNQLHHLKSLIQSTQSHQETQENTLWELKQQLEQFQQSIAKLTQKSDTETLRSEILESSELGEIERKQKTIEKNVERLIVSEETVKLEFNSLNQQQESLYQSLSQLQQEVISLDQKLDVMNQDQPQQGNEYQAAIEELKQEINTARTGNQEIETLQSSLQEIQQHQRENQSYYQSTIEELKQEINTVRTLINSHDSSDTELEKLRQLIRQIQQQQATLQTQLTGRNQEAENESSSTQEKIKHLENSLRKLTQLINSITERQAQKNETLEKKLNELQNNQPEVITENEPEPISPTSHIIENNTVEISYLLKKRLTPNAGKVNAIAISPNGQTFISGHQNKSVKLWSIETGGERYSFQDHTNEVLAVAYHPNGEIIASGSRDKTLKLWSVATGKLLTTLEGHSHEILGLTFSRDGKILGSCSKDKTVKLWSVEEETLLETLSHYQDEVSAIALSPDGKWLATGEGNIGQTVRLLQLENRELFTLEKDELAWFPGIHSLAFSPDSRFLVGGRNDNQIVLWNVKQQEEIRRFQGHENKVYTVAFHPHKNLIISGSEEATLKLWNLNTGEELLTLKGHEKAVLATAISPDGNYLISGSQDQTLLIWKSEWQSRPDLINLEE